MPYRVVERRIINCDYLSLPLNLDPRLSGVLHCTMAPLVACYTTVNLWKHRIN